MMFTNARPIVLFQGRYEMSSCKPISALHFASVRCSFSLGILFAICLFDRSAKVHVTASRQRRAIQRSSAFAGRNNSVTLFDLAAAGLLKGAQTTYSASLTFQSSNRMFEENVGAFQLLYLSDTLKLGCE
jgi:hypothetical protein